jgi:hypothetical protein
MLVSPYYSRDRAMVGELAELNGLPPDLPEIPIHIMAGQTARNPNFR